MQRTVWTLAGSLLGSVIALVYICELVLLLGVWTVSAVIPSDQILAESGSAYQVNIQDRLHTQFPFEIGSDGLYGRDSALRLQEDGRSLGPMHALHDDIRKIGGGVYSHWNEQLYFSASDNSDPRTNGRSYLVTAPLKLQPAVLAGNMLLTLVFVLVWGRNVFDWCLGRQAAVLAGGTALILVGGGSILALVAAGMLNPVNELNGSTKDWGLIRLIAGHTLIGFVLFGLVALTAMAMGALVQRQAGGRASQWLFYGYPLALPLTVLLAALFIGDGAGRWLAPLLLLLSWIPLLVWRPDRADLLRLLTVLVGCALPIAFYAFYMALLWHGPTATLGNGTQGDIAHSAGVIHTLKVSLYPLWNLAAEGNILPYGNTPPMIYGAAFLNVPGFDAMAFLTCSNGIFFGCWLASGLYGAANAAREQGEPLRDPWFVLLVTALVMTATRYPSFAVDSPAVPLAIPLIFSAFALRPLTASSPIATAAAGMSIAAGAALSKMAVFVSWPLILGFDLLQLFFRRRPTRGQLTVIVIAGVVVLAVGSVSLINWGRVYWHLYVPGPEVRILLFNQHVSDPLVIIISALRDLGWVVIGLALLRVRLGFLSAAYWCGFAAYVVYPYLFYSVAMLNLLGVAVAVMLYRQEVQRVWRMLLAGALMALPYIATRDYGGSQTFFVWVPVMVAICLFSLALTGRYVAFLQRAVLLLITSVMGLLVVGVGAGWVRIDPQFMSGDKDKLTPAMYDMWTKVRTDVEKDSLLFTDLTGPEERIGDGWNAYSAVAERQFYLSSWFTSFNDLRINVAERMKRLDINEKVLNGELSPEATELKRQYGHYYAVVRNARQVPADFALVYRNKDLSLYRIPTALTR